ncbi:GNAT family N-acetyltransferase [Roseibium sp. FZY0029]|uniref:GNAT family N-acetyltransferase n=1 Tax=Roseibium sp. FZY0029 TaxID=3116647 RepID=UPI002EBCD686|nr:GNAT family N-acetyltransferase [Roseibium sp. FZY0029]
METPGACCNARTLGTDNPDALGFDTIFKSLEEDGVFGFRLLETNKKSDLENALDEKGYRLDTWHVFVGDADTIRAATRAILSKTLPDGLHAFSGLDGAERPLTRSFQEFIAAAGIAPFSGSFLNGDHGSVVTVGLMDKAENFAACAHGYLPHNEHSPYCRYAWGGLVAVAPAHRGKGLGTYVNALMADACLNHLAATHLYELVSATNTTSRRMVEGCGLSLSQTLFSGLATKGADRFTR